MLFFLLLFCVKCSIQINDKIPVIQTKAEFQKFFKATYTAIDCVEKNLDILSMMPAVREAIGLQKFRPLFQSFQFMEPSVRLYAIEKTLICYHFYIGMLPPQSVLSSLEEYASQTNDLLFLVFLNKTILKVSLIDPASIRLKYHENRSPVGHVYNDEEVRTLSEFQSEFLQNPEKYEAEIGLMFPDIANYEDALKNVIKNILLIRNAVEDLKTVSSDLVEQILEEHSTRVQIYERLIGIHVNRCFCNKMLRLVNDGLVNGKRESVLQVYALVSKVNSDSTNVLPRSIIRVLEGMSRFDKRRQYLEWKLLTMAAKMQSVETVYFPESWYNHRPLLASLESRIVLILRPFFTEKEQQIQPTQFQRIGSELKDMLLYNPLPSDASPQEARILFLDTLEKKLPRIIKRNKKFALFSEFNEAEMQALLRASFNDLERDASEANIMDFGGAEKILADMDEKSETDVPKKFEAEKKVETIKESVIGKAEDIRKDSVAEKSEETTEASVADKEEETRKESIAEKAKETSIKLEASQAELTESKPELVEDEIQAECRLIEEEQRIIIEKYRLLKKLKVDHAKLHRHQIHLNNEAKIRKGKPRFVAFFHTDDLRLLLPQANMLFAENEINDTARHIINAGKEVKLRWIFNPSVTIDLVHYHFLCQLFNLAHGKNQLTYDNFLKTFKKLSPTKAERMTKKDFARSVFQFDHAFETEDQVFVPPIGGGHREHESSDFNHDVILKFMMRGGAHPYFFKLE